MSHSSSEMSLSSKKAKERSHQARAESTGNHPHAERIGVLPPSPNPNDYADRPSEAVRRTGQARGAARPGDTSSVGTEAFQASQVQGTVCGRPGGLLSNAQITNAEESLIQQRHSTEPAPLPQLMSGATQGSSFHGVVVARDPAANRIQPTGESNTTYPKGIMDDDLLNGSPPTFDAYTGDDTTQMQEELRKEKAANREKDDLIEKLRDKLQEVEAGHSERQTFADEISSLKLSLWQKDDRIKALEAYEGTAADLEKKLGLYEESRIRNESTIAELSQQIPTLLDEFNTANGERLQHATSVRRLQYSLMHNLRKATESFSLWLDAREQSLEKERLLRNEQRRVRNLEHELQSLEGLPEQYRDQRGKMDKLIDKQLEIEEVLHDKIDQLYNRLEEKEAKEQDLNDKIHDLTNALTDAEREGRRVNASLNQECHDLEVEKNEWKDKCSEKETELSEALDRLEYAEDFLSGSRGPGWDLNVPRPGNPGSRDLGTEGEDPRLQETSERSRRPSSQLRRSHRRSDPSKETGNMIRETPDPVDVDNQEGGAAPPKPTSGHGQLRGAPSVDLSSGPSKDLSTGGRHQARETVQPRQSSLTGDSPGRQDQESPEIDQALSRKRLRGESHIASPPKRQRTSTAEANTASRTQSVAPSVPAISTAGPSRGSASVESHSIIIDATDARRGIISQALPASVKEVLQQQISVWNKKKDKWQRRNDSERPQCLNSFADKKSTTWSYSDDGSLDTNHACTDCEDRGRVCATMSGPNALNILPVRNKGIQYAKDDARFWIAESDNAGGS